MDIVDVSILNYLKSMLLVLCFLDMLFIGRCEVDRLQIEHEENLASASMKLNNSQQSQLEASRSSYQHAIATRDATIAALKDEADQQRLSHQEELDAWHCKCQNLQSRLADAKCQSECQVRPC